MQEATGSAPGRIDMLGGVCDYSGSMVLQVATLVETRVTVATAPGADSLAITTEAFGALALPLAEARDWLSATEGQPLAARLPALRARLAALRAPRWASYVFGSLAAFCAETGWRPPAGLSLRVASRVPLAQGVSSSASIEVAVLRALRAFSGAPLGDLRLAHVGQAVENYVVGAPCGLMDQLAASLGRAGRVLPILCRPDAVQAPVPLPRGVVVVGWPSGAEHALDGASPYGVARAATFMAKAVVEAALGRKLAHITELLPSQLAPVLARVPEAMTGAAFLAAHGGVDDALSAVEPARTYALRDSARVPVEEHFRCVRRGRQRGRAVFEYSRKPPSHPADARLRSRSCARCRTRRPTAPPSPAPWRSWASTCGRRTAATRRWAWARPSSTPCSRRSTRKSGSRAACTARASAAAAAAARWPSCARSARCPPLLRSRRGSRLASPSPALLCRGFVKGCTEKKMAQQNHMCKS